MKKQLITVWEAIGPMGKSVLFIGACYNLALTFAACFLLARNTATDLFAAKELVSVAASLMDLTIVFAFFSEAYRRRFFGE